MRDARPDLDLRLNPPVANDDLNDLFATAWENHRARDFAPVLARSLTYVCAYDGTSLVGFVNVAWDGGLHAFILDPTVRPSHQRRGIGTALVSRAADAPKARGCEWLHVDYAAEAADFYQGWGFRPAAGAGLINLWQEWDGGS